MPQASGALKEVLDYPLHAWSALCSAERAGVAARGSVDQLVANLQQGLEACSAYNGLGAWELATCYTQHAGSILGLIGSDVVVVKHIEGWDIKESAQQMMLDIQEPHAPTHVFADINTKCTSSAQEFLAKFDVGVKASASEKQRGFRAMDEAMKDMEQQGRLFSRASKRFCLRHQKQCPLWDMDTSADSTRRLASFAGMTCKDASFMHRGRLGVFGPSGRPLMVYLRELRFRRPACAFTECTVGQDVGFLKQMLADMFDVHNIVISPKQLGWWCDRVRSFCIIVLKDGPFTFDVACCRRFLDVFGKSRPEDPECLRGDMFFAASADMLAESLEQALVKRGTCTKTDKWAQTLDAAEPERMLLSRRRVLHEVFGLELQELQALGAKEMQALYQAVAGSRHVIAALRQNPSHMLTMTGAVPCQLSKFKLYSLTMDRPMLPVEGLLVQGIDLQGIGTFRPPWGHKFLTFDDATQVDLVGNAINVNCAMCVFMFGLANMKPCVFPVPRAMSSAQDDADDGDGGGAMSSAQDDALDGDGGGAMPSAQDDAKDSSAKRQRLDAP